MSVVHLSLSDAFSQLQDRLAQAAERSGRKPEDIDVIAVTKTLSVERLAQAYELGLRQFGENRVQEAEKKSATLAQRLPAVSDIRWHLIGHLQTNKVKKALGIFDCVQSVDSLRLASLINQEGERRAKPVSCLIQVKISDEPSKEGVLSSDVSRLMEGLAPLSFLRLEGFMGVAPFYKDAQKTRPHFERLRKLFEAYQSSFLVERPILSMGMSHDFEVAVEEGSTMVRIGTALFGPRA